MTRNDFVKTILLASGGVAAAFPVFGVKFDPHELIFDDEGCKECEFLHSIDEKCEKVAFGATFVADDGCRVVVLRRYMAAHKSNTVFMFSQPGGYRDCIGLVAKEFNDMIKTMARDHQIPVSRGLKTFALQLGCSDSRPNPEEHISSVSIKAFTRPACYKHEPPSVIEAECRKQLEADISKLEGQQQARSRA